MTDTRHEQPRCPICRFLYRPNGDGCEPGNCSFRPADGSPEYIANAKRRAAYDRLRDAGNSAPTMEDVDAELAPKGLPVIELDGPTWVGPWRECGHSYERTIIKARVEADPSLANVIVMLDPDNQWGFWAGLIARTDVWGKGHPTPEAAQQACEAAIVAAWRNR